MTLREKMPWRFYCRGRWHSSELNSETQVFDLDFVDRDGRHLSGIRESTIKRAPRETLLRGLGGSPEAVRVLATLLTTPLDEPELAVRQGKLLASRLLPWARSGHLRVPRFADYVLAPTERGEIDNLRLTETDVPAPDEGYVQVRVEAAGLNFRDVLNILGLYSGDLGRSAATSPAPSPNW